MQIIETQNLTLRAFCLSDLEDFYHYAHMPNVGPTAGWKPHESRSESLKILNDFIEKGVVYALFHKKEGKVIGSIGLHEDHMRNNPTGKMLGFVVSAEYWGKGLATEASVAIMHQEFKSGRLTQINCYHYADNMASKRVIEKCGFRFEGVLRGAIYRYDGCLKDIYCYSILDCEFEMYEKVDFQSF